MNPICRVRSRRRAVRRPYVDHSEGGSGEDRARPVELVEQPRDGGVGGVACGAEDAHPQDAVLRVGDDVGVRLEQLARGRRGRVLLPCAPATAGIIRVSAL